MSQNVQIQHNTVAMMVGYGYENQIQWRTFSVIEFKSTTQMQWMKFKSRIQIQ